MPGNYHQHDFQTNHQLKRIQFRNMTEVQHGAPLKKKPPRVLPEGTKGCQCQRIGCSGEAARRLRSERTNIRPRGNELL